MAQPQRIMIVRHGEKPYPADPDHSLGVRTDGSPDVESLTVRGWQRAGALSALFGSAEMAARRGLSVPGLLYASAHDSNDPTGSKSRRPHQTLIPLAQRTGLVICSDWTKGQEADLCREVLAQNGTVLISWQHERIPAIAAGIPGGNIPATQTWADERFDLVWVFDLLADGTYRFQEVHQALLSSDLAA